MGARAKLWGRFWWTQVVFVVFIYCGLKMMLTTYFQWIYSSTRPKFAVLQIDFDEADNVRNLSLFEETRRQLNGSIQIDKYLADLTGSRRWLKSLGAPYFNLNFVAIFACLTLLSPTLFTHLQSHLYFNILNPLDSYLVRLVINEEAELAYCWRLIDKELTQYLMSSENFVQICVELSQRIGNQQTGGLSSSEIGALERFGAESRLDRVIRGHQRTVRDLREFKRLKLLMPSNRSPKNVRELTLSYCLYSWGNLIYSFCLDVFLLILAQSLAGYPLQLAPMDLVAMAEIWFVTELQAISTDLDIALFNSNARDQTKLIKETRVNLLNCINENEASFVRLQRDKEKLSGKASNKLTRSCYAKLNRNLLLAHIRYRVLVAQLGPVKRSFSFTALTIFSIILMVPLLLRVISLYDSQYNDVAIMFCITTVLLSNFILIPVCVLHKQGKGICKSMWSLMAHVVGLMEQSGPKRDVYDAHMVRVISKELDDLEKLLDQFAVKTLGLSVTYTNLVRIHYWFGLLAISSSFEIMSWQKLFGDRLEDPLGAMSDIKNFHRGDQR